MPAMTDRSLSAPRPVRYERPQSPAEEIANSASHGVGLVAALVGAPILVTSAARHGTIANVIGAGIFAATTILLYGASAIYHAMPNSPTKKVFRTIDHGAIFLLIAGSYTPFTLGVLRGGWGWSLLGIVWGLAVLGVTLKAVDRLYHPVASTALYIGMGWLAIVAIRPLWLNVPLAGNMLMLGGGIAYTGGVAFYTNQRLLYSHLLWHLCVLAGTVCHYLAVLWYAYPRG